MLTKDAAFEAVIKNKPVELLWFRPGGTAWGASDDLRTMLLDIRAIIRKSLGPNMVAKSTLVVPAASRNEPQKERFDWLFDEGLVAPPGFLSPAVEILLVRGVAAIILVKVPLSKDVGVWIGLATT